MAAYADEWPKPEEFDCNYYLELETHLKCKEKGSEYLVAYAYPHCVKFKEKMPTWSAPLRAFVQGTGLCLMEMLYDNRRSRLPDCQTLEEFAFDSHAMCYKQYGYCDLTNTEKLQISGTVEWLTFFTKFRQLKTQFENITAKCIAN